MWKYVLKRLLLTIPIIIGVIFVVFTILYFAPGDVTIQILGNQWTPEAAAALRQELGLDQTFFVQFFNYVSGACCNHCGSCWDFSCIKTEFNFFGIDHHFFADRRFNARLLDRTFAGSAVFTATGMAAFIGNGFA